MASREGELFVERVEVNLDGRQIFCLFCGGAVIASLVFVLGVAVGRRVEAREHPGRAASGASSDPLAALDRLADDGAAPGPEQELAFASTLRGGGTGLALGAVDRSIASAARSAREEGEDGEDGADRPSEPAEPAAMLPARPLVAPRDEAAKAKAEATKAEAAKAEAAKAEAARAEAARLQAARAEQARAEAAKAEAAKAEAAKAEAAKAEAAKAESAKPAAAGPEPGAGEARFTLHLLSFERRSEADALVARLRKAGYQPYVIETPEPDKGTMFRVRLGRFASFDEAVAGKTDFEEKQNIIAYVTRTRR